MTDIITTSGIIFMPDSTNYLVVQITDEIPGNVLPPNCVGVARISALTAAAISVHITPPTAATPAVLPIANLSTPGQLVDPPSPQLPASNDPNVTGVEN